TGHRNLAAMPDAEHSCRAELFDHGAVRAPALPAQSRPGGGSEGAVEAPSDWSPAIATWPRCRTQSTVVAWNFSIIAPFERRLCRRNPVLGVARGGPSRPPSIGHRPSRPGRDAGRRARSSRGTFRSWRRSSAGFAGAIPSWGWLGGGRRGPLAAFVFPIDHLKPCRLESC